ncbi:GNAT family N-acetyltransferase [Gorillibacterium sp. sgz5001074]|uniref:GNAT family N-acetyltransferase n=1 Tax=Gorillibacterium sp. sgz5001074 TaxID=3446695 RepID=UPI003F66BB2B
MIRLRNPVKDDPRLLRLVITRLMPFARKARPETTINRREIIRRWRDCRVKVAVKNHIPVGFVSCKVAGGVLTIDMLAVDRRVEGQGFGSALIGAAEKYGKRQGALLSQLAVDEPNTHAQRFYERKGYGVEVYLPEHRLYILSKKL